MPAVIVRRMGLSATEDDFLDEVLGVQNEDPGLALRVIHATTVPSPLPW